MKKVTLFVAIIEILILNGCIDSNTPAKVTKKYLYHFYHKEYSKAKNYVTVESYETLDSFEKISDILSVLIINDKVEEPMNITCIEEGEKAVCEYTLTGETLKIFLVKENGNWLVDLKNKSSEINDKEIKQVNPDYEKNIESALKKISLNDYRGAINDCDKAIEIDSTMPDVYCYRGNAKSEISKYWQEAILDYNKAIELGLKCEDHSIFIYYNNRGRVKCKLHDYNGAILDFNKSIEFNPNDADAYESRGDIKYKIGDIDGACLDWSKEGELSSIYRHTDAYEKIRKHCNN